MAAAAPTNTALLQAIRRFRYADGPKKADRQRDCQASGQPTFWFDIQQSVEAGPPIDPNLRETARKQLRSYMMMAGDISQEAKDLYDLL